MVEITCMIDLFAELKYSQSEKALLVSLKHIYLANDLTIPTPLPLPFFFLIFEEEKTFCGVIINL